MRSINHTIKILCLGGILLSVSSCAAEQLYGSMGKPDPSPAAGDGTEMFSNEQMPSKETATIVPTLSPQTEISKCHGNTLFFHMAGHSVNTKSESGYYLVCSDGSSVQRISDELPCTTSLAASSVRNVLGVSYRDECRQSEGRIAFIDLANYASTDSIIADYTIYNLQWSLDGQYLAYIRSEANSLDTHLEILYADTQTISRLLTAQQILYFSWSRDSKHLAFTLLPPDPGGVPKIDISDVECDPATHTCKLLSTRETSFVSTTYAWSPDSSSLTSASSRRGSFLTTDLSGKTVNEIMFNDLSLGTNQVDSIVWSPDGASLAFVADSNQQIFVLQLKNMSMLNITPIADPNINYYDLTWLGP